MVSEQPTRKMIAEFTDAGWKSVRTKGSHSVYECSCGAHSYALPDGHRTVSPGVVRKARQAIATCPTDTTK